MRWRGRRMSGNVQDRRSYRRAGVATGGIGTTIVIALMFWLSGGDPQILVDTGVLDPGVASPATPASSEEEELVGFVRVVLADTEDVWNQLFRERGIDYAEPQLILFRGQVDSACGFASAAVGPFYCPRDQDVYLDLQFFDELNRRFGAPGDFAQAYVIAHEVGHHVQTLTGVSDYVMQQRAQSNETDANRWSVRQELQADYLAGVWAHHVQRLKEVLDPGDVEEALRAANAIGDDRLQRKSRGVVVPDSFTHGTSEQRLRWFRRGYETGDFAAAEILFELEYDEL